jgi:hypothetical protein
MWELCELCVVVVVREEKRKLEEEALFLCDGSECAEQFVENTQIQTETHS